MRPVVQRRRDLWPANCCSFGRFQYAAGMVQSRSFHIRTVNWVTDEHTEGDIMGYLLNVVACRMWRACESRLDDLQGC